MKGFLYRCILLLFCLFPCFSNPLCGSPSGTSKSPSKSALIKLWELKAFPEAVGQLFRMPLDPAMLDQTESPFFEPREFSGDPMTTKQKSYLKKSSLLFTQKRKNPLKLIHYWSLPTEAWNSLVNYDLFEIQQAKTSKHLILIGLFSKISERTKLGIAYHYSHQSNGYIDLHYNNRGLFLNFITEY